MRNFLSLLLIFLLGCGALAPQQALAEETGAPAPTAPTAGEKKEPSLEFKIGEKGKPDNTLTVPIRMLVIMTLLSFIPALFMMMTCFTRIIIVLGFLRHALSTQQIPPNMVLIGLSLFLTLFIMAPVFEKSYANGYKPFLDGKLTQEEAVTAALKPLREFMGKQTRKKDLLLFIELSNKPRPQTFDDVPTTTLIPAFVTSELRTAFQMGFLLFLPFIIIDLVVASILMSLGMMMLPPAMITLPIKLMVFVLADGWRLIIQSLVVSFGAT
jgi:flagellar biosynthetic protein FliP